MSLWMLPKHLNSAKCLEKPEVKQYCESLKKELPSQDEIEKNKYRKIGGIIISMSMYVLRNTLPYLLSKKCKESKIWGIYAVAWYANFLKNYILEWYTFSSDQRNII